MRQDMPGSIESGLLAQSTVQDYGTQAGSHYAPTSPFDQQFAVHLRGLIGGIFLILKEL
jgi:hypothetical protein